MAYLERGDCFGNAPETGEKIIVENVGDIEGNLRQVRAALQHVCGYGMAKVAGHENVAFELSLGGHPSILVYLSGENIWNINRDGNIWVHNFTWAQILQEITKMGQEA